MSRFGSSLFFLSSLLLIAGCPSTSGDGVSDAARPELAAQEEPRADEERLDVVDEEEKRDDQERAEGEPADSAAAKVVQTLDEPTSEESAKTHLPEKIEIVASPSLESTLDCPEGARQFTSENTIWCAKPAEAGGMPERHGPMIRFHPDGKVQRETRAVDGKTQGQNWLYRPDGSLERFTKYKDNKRHGLSVEYFSNGKRHNEGFYRHGKEHGTFKFWNDQGNLVRVSTYEEGRLVSQKLFQRHASELPTDPELKSDMREAISDMLEHASPEDRELMKEGMKELLEHLGME